MTYYQVTKKMSNVFDLRLRMVRMAEEEGISATARHYRTTRKTVQKWGRRYREGGLGALKNRSRAPKRIPHKMSPELERKIVRLRTKYRAWGPKRLKMYFDLPCSEGAIYRVLRQNGLIRKRKKKWKKRGDLRRLKAALKPFEKILVDGKHLTDIEHYWPQMRFKRLPRYQYTARDVRTGATYFAFSETNDSTSATIFIRYVLEHLGACGVDLTQVTVQTDNGSDLVGSANQRPSKRSAFACPSGCGQGGHAGFSGSQACADTASLSHLERGGRKLSSNVRGRVLRHRDLRSLTSVLRQSRDLSTVLQQRADQPQQGQPDTAPAYPKAGWPHRRRRSRPASPHRAWRPHRACLPCTRFTHTISGNILTWLRRAP